MDTQAHRKSRGAFFTPPELSRFVVEWAVRGRADRVLDPSCGDAAFLEAAAERLTALGASTATLGRGLHGVEIHHDSAMAAAQRFAGAGFAPEIRCADFFDVEPPPLFDAVVGNPPYVRYQNFAGAARAKGSRAALAQGVRLTGLASSWAAFTIHAARFLTPDGRLGLVLPAELLTVNYAASVRRFLLDRFASVRLVLFEELVFPNVLEEVVLLLAEGAGGAPSFEILQARDTRELGEVGAAASWVGFTPSGDDKWTPALLPTAALGLYRRLTLGAGFATLLDWGETSLGAVTGNNHFFTLTRRQVAELGLATDEVRRISPPGARHLRALAFAEAAWERLAGEGGRCYLFHPTGPTLSAGATRLIAGGEAAGVDRAYKCRVRRPWWRVPLVAKPDLLFTYMNHDRPRLIANGAGVLHLNSLYGVTLRRGMVRLGRELLPIACLNSATLLGGEMVGRAYGGGLLKHEPKEADRLPVPSLSTLKAAAPELRALAPLVDEDLRHGDLAQAVARVDAVLLGERLGLAAGDVAALRCARDHLFQRRVTRGRAGGRPGGRGDRGRT